MRDFLIHAVLFMWQALIFTYILEPVCTGLYGDAAKLIHRFIGAWKNWISENYFCRYKILAPFACPSTRLDPLIFSSGTVFSLINSSSIPPNHPDSSKIQTSEQALTVKSEIYIWGLKLFVFFKLYNWNSESVDRILIAAKKHVLVLPFRQDVSYLSTLVQLELA